MKTLTIDQNPSVADNVLFNLKTTDENNNLIDPYKVESVKIYFVERDFGDTEQKEYNFEINKNPSLVITGNLNSETRIVDNLAYNTNLKVGMLVEGDGIKAGTTISYVLSKTSIMLSYPASKTLAGASLKFSDTSSIDPVYSDTFYYKSVIQVKNIGTGTNPAWFSEDINESLITKTDSIGHFEFTWNPVGMREGDYFVCWSWAPRIGQDLFSDNIKFNLSSSNAVSTTSPAHHTAPDKYETLLDRYLPEMYKVILTDTDRSPDVLKKFNDSIAQGFTALEDIGNQIVDLLDSNAVGEYMMTYLSNTLDVKLKSQDPTLWRRQIKEAVPLYKRKGTLGSLKDSFSQAGMRLIGLQNFWQITSPFFIQESFFVSDTDTFKLSKKPASLITDHFEIYLTKNNSTEAINVDISKVKVFENEYGESFVQVSDVDFNKCKVGGPSFLCPGDTIRFSYYFKIPSGEAEISVDDYIKNLQFVDEREEKTIVDGQSVLTIPLKNWNVRLLSENDPMVSSILTKRHPFIKNVVFGKIRTEFPYSENVYNMDEYNGCCVGSTLVVTENGIKKIKDIKDDKFIMTEFGFKLFEELKNQGKKETFKITTNLGRSISVTPNHKFKVLSESGLNWKESSQLGVGDYVLCKKGNCNSIPKNKGLDKDLWYLAGHLYGDGNLYQKNNNARSFRWLISEKEPEIKELISKILENNNAKFHIFCIDKIKHQKHTNFKCNEDLHRICSSSVEVPILDQIIPKYETKGRWRRSLPALIWQSGEEQICSFLKGIFDTDGGIQKRQPLLTTKWKNLAQEIQNLLLIIGIISSVTSYRVSWKGRRRKYFRVRIVGKNSRNLFVNKIGFNSSAKNKSLVDAIELEKNSILEADRTIIPFGDKIIKNIFPFRKRVSKARVADRTREEKRVITLITRLKQGYQKTIPDNIVSEIHQKIQQFKINGLEAKFIGDYVDNDWFFEKIKDISPSTYEYVFDPLNVEDTSSYISNGIVSHNSTRDSLDPCDIDKDFLDSCSYCRSGKFDIDLEIENLSDDRISEVREIISENTPFHSILKTINLYGGQNEFVAPPIEDYDILIENTNQESVIAGATQLWFYRNKLLNQIDKSNRDNPSATPAPGGQLKIRSDMTSKELKFSGRLTFKNEKIALFSSDLNLADMPISENCYLAVTSGLNFGEYLLSKVGKFLTVDGILEPLSTAPFNFKLYNKLFSYDTEFVTKDDIIELSDSTVYFKDLNITTLPNDNNFKVKIDIGGSYHNFDIKEILPNNKLLLVNNSNLLNSNITNKAYSILDGNLDAISLKGEEKTSNCNISHSNRSKVKFNNTEKMSILKNNNNYVFFTVSGKAYLCKVIGYSTADDVLYIDTYDGGNLGSTNLEYRQILLPSSEGYLSYIGLQAICTTNLEQDLGIVNGKNSTSITKKESDSFKEDFSISIRETYDDPYITLNSYDNYYFISEIDGSTIWLSGLFENFGTEGIEIQVEIYKYTKNNAVINEDYLGLPQEQFSINRSGKEIINRTVKDSSGFTNYMSQKEGVSFEITTLDGSKEKGEI
jgi:intein/homing endonuclease